MTDDKMTNLLFLFSKWMMGGGNCNERYFDKRTIIKYYINIYINIIFYTSFLFQ